MKKILCLLILIAILTLPLASCGYSLPDHAPFDSYPEFVEYAEKFCEHRNSELSGIFFDLDDESAALNKTYYAEYLVSKYYLLGDLYQPIDYSWGMNFSLSFYMVDTERSDNDPQYSYFIQVDSIGGIPGNMNINGKIEYITGNVNDPSSPTDGLGNYFNYFSDIQIDIDDMYAGYVLIYSAQEITDEKIDEIYQILIDNIVFYR